MVVTASDGLAPAPASRRTLATHAALALAGALLLIAPAFAGPTAAAAPAAADGTRLALALREQAGQIRDLVHGRLDPSVDADSLFTLDLAGEALGQDPGAALYRLLGEIGSRRRQPGAPPGSGELGAARAELEAALVDFLRRPAAERQRLLARHAERRRQADAKRLQQARDQAHLAELEQTAALLEQLLDGKLAPGTDPAPLLRIELAEPSEIGADPARRRRFLEEASSGAAPRGPAGAAPETKPANPQVAAHRKLDALRLRWLALTPAERTALLERLRPGTADESARQAEVQRKAEEARHAALEQAKAQDALRRAQTEGARLAAEERVRLLASRSSLVAAETELRKLREEADAGRERALGWLRQARELEARSVLDGDREGDADRAYERLVIELTAARSVLGAALDDLASRRSRVPDPPPPPELQLDDDGLPGLRVEVAATARRLRLLEDGLRWERVSKEREAMESMNQVRLRLLGLTSPQKRSALRGFGPTGVRQAGREFTQIGLELRYHRHWLPRLVGVRLKAARTAPLPELVGLAELTALWLAFRWWRRRADRALREMQLHFRSRRPPSPLDRAGWSLAWYLRRTRAPLEWLALSLVLSQFPTVTEVAELGYLLLVLAWALAGWMVMRLLDAVAARQGELGEGTAALRWRSLRLSGVTVVVIGLLLSIADRSVGRGTLYSWISSGAWLVVLPVVVILVAWWRPTIFLRLRIRENPGVLLGWSLAHAKGVASYPAATLAGLLLLLEGARNFLSRQASQLTAARRILAWLFRRELERQAATRVRTDQADPLPGPLREALDPEQAGGCRVDGYGEKVLARLRGLAQAPGSVIAVVGERGLGKSTLLDRLLEGSAPAGAIRVATRPGTFETLVADLAEASHLDGERSDTRLAEHLRRLSPPLIVLDDVQRILRPLIGGLREVDRLLALARAVGTASSWVLAVGTPGYGYLERARADRVTFDETLRLPPWTLEEITELVLARSRLAGVEPSFDELMVARPGDAVSEDGRRDRTERDFYGLLWDYAGGNPAVALDLWRESLGRRPGADALVVRLADMPSADDLKELPLAFFFVMRAVLQLELATEQDVASCTDLRLPDVADALRLARAQGLVEPVGDRLRVSLRWYRAVTQGLRRRHLVAF